LNSKLLNHLFKHATEKGYKYIPHLDAGLRTLVPGELRKKFNDKFAYLKKSANKKRKGKKKAKGEGDEEEEEEGEEEEEEEDCGNHALGVCSTLPRLVDTDSHPLPEAYAEGAQARDDTARPSILTAKMGCVFDGPTDVG
jgi:hypothetical protein